VVTGKTPTWARRLVEWGVVAVLLVVVLGLFGRQMRDVQGRAELAAVQTTLGALRTALVLEHIRQTVSGNAQNVAVPQRNPFLLLDSIPPNYAGERAVLKAETTAPGSWMFDPVCSCIGYVLLYPEWLDSPRDLPALWFSVLGRTAPLSIQASGAYVWQGQVVN
jgi:hypothetical protein